MSSFQVRLADGKAHHVPEPGGDLGLLDLLLVIALLLLLDNLLLLFLSVDGVVVLDAELDDLLRQLDLPGLLLAEVGPRDELVDAAVVQVGLQDLQLNQGLVLSRDLLLDRVPGRGVLLDGVQGPAFLEPVG